MRAQGREGALGGVSSRLLDLAAVHPQVAADAPVQERHDGERHHVQQHEVNGVEGS